ncbi:uridine diphosphate glucose pyrophosphatase NUDT14 isoform X1 [Octopus bimaculoides]|uniref:Uridine diphosphate glucose pyrophosphatase NUDT14 n=1 Tax=Octopus bimaculoides TaxID=37653 RepID=A0A0L8FRQ9_OCTBM|nr:uridine diphosphate glucose pyrophosphatase NUDT14 isoform X1 [Octopus bimaculoides]|eukprot:XP_014787558.1 PREDICTED: uridine diphosphate glucose pyrophosphatase-like isoform X1 [Octopus bimaculoides]
MENISDVTVSTFDKSKYIKPIRLHYKQNGEAKSWDFIKTADSVCVLLFNRQRQVLLFVKQFRPVIYMNRSCIHEEKGVKKIDSTKYTGELGITTELCAGIVDKNISLQEVVQAEILEECGYKVPLDNIERVVSYRGGVSTTGALVTFFYAEIDDKMKVSKGGGVPEEGEMIELLEVPVKNARAFVMDESEPKPGGLHFAIFWFFDTKWKE